VSRSPLGAVAVQQNAISLNDLTSLSCAMGTRLKIHFVLFDARTGSDVKCAVYRPYLLVASPWLLRDSGIATIVPLHGGIPVPAEIHFATENGGPASALRAALHAVLSLPENRDLQTIPASLEEFEEW
jgi:hypothetical protein